jgi:hypothetical protein
MSMQVSDTMAIPACKVSVSVDSAATPEQIVGAVDAVCSALQRQESSVERLRVLLGRMMVEIKDRRMYWPAYRTFGAFERSVIERHRMSRTVIRDAIMVARRLPMLKPEAAEGIPITNITLAARAAKGMEAADVRGLLKSAARMNVVEFKAAVHEQGLVGKRGRRPGVVMVRIAVSRSLAARWTALVGDKSPAKVLAELMAGSMEAAAA